MEDFSERAYSPTASAHGRAATEFLMSVYNWMFAGLLLTAAVAWIVAGSETLLRFIVFNKWVFYGLLIGELALVIGISWGINKLSAGAATFLFLVYSAVNGATLSVVFLLYTSGSILLAFVSAACLFGSLSLVGYITKRDLSSLGTLLFGGLIALIASSILNFFLASSALDFIISIGGIVVFLGLTAYDTQKILRIGAGNDARGFDQSRKLVILGALALYLDFINLFLYLLRLLGKKR